MLNIKINNYYLVNEDIELDQCIHVHGFSNSFTPQNSLKKSDTLHIYLSKNANELLRDMNATTRRQIRRAEENGFEQIVIESPSDQDLKDFQKFYNQFARNKKTYKCTSFHMKTMKLLREQHHFVMTFLENNRKEKLCYRVYITDGKIAMNLYTASHFRMRNNPDFKKNLSQASRYLLWKNMLWFKGKGYLLYDFGGLTDVTNIRNFKLGFGGKIVLIYSGYETNSKIGRLILKLRNLKLKSAAKFP